mmetsp:Transcript_18082/g.30664  ORF Transcript_18082/g.30664 Transcript_18082/m.30664 type:complete len:747 (-) Transcript_18082:66-2306(-)
MMRNNNPLNLFPTTQTSQAAQLKLQRLLYSTLNRGPTQIQSTIASTLFNDQIDYMSTLDMNRAASFTFGYQNNIDTTTGHGGESVANELWELILDAVLCRPTEHSILALTKTISLLEHVLVNGAERVCLDGELLYRIEMAVGPLRELNTALVEQQLIEQILTTNNSDDNTSNDNGRARGNNDVVLIANGIGEQLTNFSTKAAATMLKLRGGSIDKGHPVRMAADKLYTLVSNPNNLRQLRLEKASSSNTTTSLVPIGSANKAGFITDEGRYRLLQQKMAREEKDQQAAKRKEHQQLQQTRSNLIGPASTDGFGGGYSGANGSTKTQVVGAAHSLEDMIKSAKFELEQHKNKRAEQIASLKKGYSDNPHEVARKLQELERNDVTRDPKFIEKERGLQQALEYLEELQREQQEKEEEENVGDLLGGGDFFGGNTNAVNGGMNHSQDFGGGSEDLLGFQSNVSPVPVSFSQPDVFGASSSGGTTADLLGFDGFAGPSPQQPQQHHQQQQIQQQQQYYQSQPHQINTITDNSSSMMGNGSFLPSPEKLEMRPSLVTGMRGPPATGNSNAGGDDLWKGWHATSSTNDPVVPPVSTYTDDLSSYGAMGGIPGSAIPQPDEENEDVKLEKERKMNLAAGLFAGVFPDNTTSSSGSGARTNSMSPTTPDPFESMLPTPPMEAPPPPPIDAPPPPPPNVPPPPPPPTNGDVSVEQMQEIIRQQQEQMNQMMQMMQQMGMQGGAPNSNNGVGGWPS